MRLHSFPFRLKTFAVRRGAEGGNVAVLFAVLLPLIIGGAGVGVETTYWRYEQLQLQSAADAAAFAGGVEKRGGASDAAIQDAATLAAGQNGFDPSAGTIEVTAPSTAAGVSTPNALQVVLHSQAPRFFTAAFISTPINLQARAVATFSASASACTLALDPAAPQALLVSGSASATFRGCNLVANSIAADAVKVANTASLTAPCVVSGGGASMIGQVTYTECSAPVTQAPRAADPYAALPVPAASGPCQNDNRSTLSPGNYCNGIQLNNDTTLQPGVYVVSGGDFRINGSGVVAGSGVTIYLQGASRVRINGAATVQLSAPTSGPYAGVLFYGDRSSLGGSNLFNGTAASRLTGALYFASQAVDYQGNFSGQSGCVQVVARTIQWTGSTTVNVDCSAQGMKTVPVLGVVRLAE